MNLKSPPELTADIEADAGNPQSEAVSPALLASLSPYDVADKAQLFVDQFLVHESRGVSFTPHAGAKHPNNPVLKCDLPWEGWRITAGTVIFDDDEKIFKMWYSGDLPGCFPHSPYSTLYSTSEDGVHWEKPLVGTVAANDGTLRHNAVNYSYLPSVIKDPHEPDPQRRYKSIRFMKGDFEQKGYHTLTSPDGLHWKHYSQEAIAPGSDVITGYYDEYQRMYVAFPRLSTVVRGHQRRVFYLITSRDFDNWTEMVPAWTPDERDDVGTLRRVEEVRELLTTKEDDPAIMRTEFYGVGAHVTESCTVGFPWIFSINNKAAASGGKNQEGPGEIQLAVSRDLQNWDRTFRTPIIPRGQIGEWDSGFFTSQSRAVVVGDEVLFYYQAGNYTHGSACLYDTEYSGRGTEFTSGVGLVKWQRDRFVSADASDAGGVLTTVPIVFSGERLEINARIHHGGGVRVEVLDAAGQPLPQWKFSNTLRGDELRHIVRWDGDKPIGQLAGKPVCLRFHLRDAQLFSFAFRK